MLSPCCSSHIGPAPCKHLQNSLIVFLQISFVINPPLEKNLAVGWDSCETLKSLLWPPLFHCALVLPCLSPPAPSELTCRGWISEKELCLPSAFGYCSQERGRQECNQTRLCWKEVLHGTHKLHTLNSGEIQIVCK